MVVARDGGCDRRNYRHRHRGDGVAGEESENEESRVTCRKA